MPTTATASTTIDAPRERVFDLVSDLSARAAFTDHFIDELRLQRLDPTGVGASARFRIDAGRKPIWMETVIAELDPPHRLVERGRGGRSDRVPVNTAWTVVEGGAGTEVTVVFWAEEEHPFDRVRGVISRRAAQRGWRRALERLKELAEAGEPVERTGVAGASRL